MTNSSTPASLAKFVNALVGIGGQLVTTISHMSATPAPPDAESIPDVLRKLLTEVFATELHAPDVDLKRAARVLNAAGRAIEENLYLVPVSVLESQNGHHDEPEDHRADG